MIILPVNCSHSIGDMSVYKALLVCKHVFVSAFLAGLFVACNQTFRRGQGHRTRARCSDTVHSFA
jgi:hypothetical protein